MLLAADEAFTMHEDPTHLPLEQAVLLRLQRLHPVTEIEQEVLLHGGKVSHKEAEAHIAVEFKKYSKELGANAPDEFYKAVKRLGKEKS